MARNDFVIQLGDEDELDQNESQEEEVQVKKPEIIINTQESDDNEEISNNSLVKPSIDTDHTIDQSVEDAKKIENLEIQTKSFNQLEDKPISESNSYGTRRVAGIKISVDMDELQKDDYIVKDKDQDNKKVKQQKEQKLMEEEAKKTIKSNIMSEMAEKGLQMSEDIEPNEIKLEIFNEANKKRKLKRNMIKTFVILLILSLIGAGTYYGISNKDMLASLIKKVEVVEKTIIQTKDRIVKEEIIVKEEVIVDNLDNIAKSIESKGYYLIPKITFQNIGREDFYAIYINDINYVNNLKIAEEIKKRFFETVNIAVHGLESGNMDYPAFRKKYNSIINKVLDYVK